MKTTLNPFENAKRTANGTGGGVSPAVIEEIQAEISILGSQNETQAQDITDIKGSLNSINDNLSKKTEIIELWTNQSPSASIVDNTLINLSSANYEILIVLIKANTTSNTACLSSFALKGMDIFVSYTGQNQIRILRYQSDTQYEVSNSTATDGCIPMRILGIKNLT